MSDKFISLKCDDDIIQISTDSFTVGRLRELVISGIRGKILNFSNNINVFHQCIPYLRDFKIYDKDINVDDIQFQILKDCRLLKIGGKSWQTGKIKIRMSISPMKKYFDYVDLEFCPDEPEIPESPLDDLRKSLNNK